MPEELETILRLVAEGTLTPDEAAPIIAALTRGERDAPPPQEPRDRASRHAARVQRHLERAERRMDAALARAGGRHLRIRVTERGRQVVNLRIPVGFVDAALRFVPGLAGDQAERIRDAVQAGAVGPILDIDDEGSGVLISVE
jgi:hypothetical protein